MVRKSVQHVFKLTFLRQTLKPTFLATIFLLKHFLINSLPFGLLSILSHFVHEFYLRMLTMRI